MNLGCSSSASSKCLGPFSFVIIHYNLQKANSTHRHQWCATCHHAIHTKPSPAFFFIGQFHLGYKERINKIIIIIMLVEPRIERKREERGFDTVGDWFSSFLMFFLKAYFEWKHCKASFEWRMQNSIEKMMICNSKFCLFEWVYQIEIVS